MLKLAFVLFFVHLCTSQENSSVSSYIGTSQSPNTPKKQNSSIEYNWRETLKKIYGANTTSNEFISEKGFSNLIIKLGLKNKSNSSQCYSPTEMRRRYSNDTSRGITEDQFIKLCPIILFQIEQRVCRTQTKKEFVKDKTTRRNDKDYVQIWLYSFGAVMVCSMVGLVVVWLIPILPKSYYNSISQLLIALAVGSLTGDALLHLIPHALMDEESHGHSHGNESQKNHNLMVWKALAAFCGIHVFFLTERITILCQNLKSKRKSKNKQAPEYQEVPSGDTFEDPEKAMVKFSDHKSLSMGKLHWATKSRKYSSSSHELEHTSSNNGLNVDANMGAHLCNRPKSKPHVNSDCPDSMNLNLCHTINPYSMTEESVHQEKSGSNMDTKVPFNGDVRSSNNQLIAESRSPEKGGHNSACTKHAHNDLLCINQKEGGWSIKDDDKLLDHGHLIPNINNNEMKTKSPESVGEIGAGGATVMSSLAPHPYSNKPHGHHHGHSHDLSSVKAIAYTVIAGDGLHNFCDGIAIGAAFANDLRGGFSTAIAVLCHELPHELGDFVVLLHAGMSFRTAIFYNLMSSIFCAAGMVIGVLLGAIPSVSNWIFMITAGMFLYIALVDMMPELSTRRLQGNKLFHRPSILFLWQNVGLILGAVIMLLIALFEEDMF